VNHPAAFAEKLKLRIELQEEKKKNKIAHDEAVNKMLRVKERVEARRPSASPTTNRDQLLRERIQRTELKLLKDLKEDVKGRKLRQ